MPKTLKNKKYKRKNKTHKNKDILISSDFESGNIIKLESTTNNNVHLEIRGEKYEKKQTNKYRNWFYFKAKNVNNKTTFTIHDLKNYDNDWIGYTVCYSYDNKKWKTEYAYKIHSKFHHFFVQNNSLSTRLFIK